MADLQSRIGGKLPKNTPDGPSKKKRPFARRGKVVTKLEGAHGHNYSDSNFHHPNPYSGVHLRRQDGSPQKSFNSPVQNYRGFNSGFEAHPGTPTNTEFAVSNTNVGSASSSPSSLLSRLSPGKTGVTDTRLDVSPAVPSLLDRITAQAEDRETESFRSASSSMGLMSPEKPQVGASVDEESIQMDVDLNPCGEILTAPLTNNSPLGSTVVVQDNDLVSLDNNSEPPSVAALNNHSHSPLHDNQINNNIQPQSDLPLNDSSEPTSLIDPDIVPTPDQITSPTADPEPLPSDSPISEAAVDSLLQPDIEVGLGPSQGMIVADDPPPTDVIPTPSIEPDLSGRPQTNDRITDQPRNSTPPFTDQCRDLLLPVILENAKRRGYGEGEMKVEDGARDLLTDEACGVFIGKARAVQREMEARRADERMDVDREQEGESLGYEENSVVANGGNGVRESGENGGENNMWLGAGQPLDGVKPSMSPSISAIPQAQLPQHSTSVIPAHTHLASSPSKQPPQAPRAMLLKTKERAMEALMSSNAATDTKIDTSLPKRPQWEGTIKADPVHDHEHNFGTRKQRGRTKSVPSRQDDPPLPSRPHFGGKEMLRAHRMRSESTSGPSPWTLPPVAHEGPPPQAIAIPLDPQFFAPPPVNEKESERTNSLSPNRYPRYHTRQSSPSLSPHRSPSPPHSRLRSYSPTRRSYSPRRQRSRSPSSHYHYNRRTIQRSRSPSRPSNLDPSVASSIASDSCTNSTSHFHQTQTPVSSACDQSEDQKLTHIQTTTTPAPPPSTSIYHNVPGLWFVKTGLDSAGILEFNFDVDEKTAITWDLTDEMHFNPTPRSKRKYRRKLSLHLLCLPTPLVQSTYESLDLSTATASGIATAMWNLKTVWPPKGKLVVEVNAKCAWGRTWLPIDLDPTSPPLDFSTCIRGGTNCVRFIQLDGLSGHMFVLHASQTSATLEKRRRINPDDMQSLDTNRDRADLNSFLAPTVAALNLRPDNIGVFKFQTKVKLF